MGPQPPSKFRIFAAGVNDTLKGAFVFNDSSAASVIEDFQARSVDFSIDYDHAMVSEDSRQSERIAAGWFVPTIVNGELWATDVRWTEEAAEAILKKEWRYISPAFISNGNVVARLINVGLTNIPASLGAAPLVLSQTGGTHVDIVKLTGADSSDNAVAILHAWKSSHERLVGVERERDAAVTELSALRGEIEGKEKATLIEKLAEDGKITPAMRPVIEALSVGQIKAFADVAPVVLSRQTATAPTHTANDVSIDVFEGHSIQQLSASTDYGLLDRLSRANKGLFEQVKSAREVK